MYAVMYHRVFKNSVQKGNFDGITFDEFKFQMNYFKNNYGINKIEFNEECPNKNIILTFDDGYKDFYNVSKYLAINNLNAIFY